MTGPESKYVLALSALPGISVDTIKTIERRFGCLAAFFEAKESEVAAICGTNSPVISSHRRHQAFESAENELSICQNQGINILPFDSPDYPAMLRQCQDAPAVLYTCGDCRLNAAHIISIVGTRHASHYGVTVIKKLISELKERLDDLLIVSGLAYGADITAHRACIECGVPTVAVFAHGLQTVYPAAHRHDAVNIVHSGGALITEYRYGTRGAKGNFLARNRIVAGMSHCTVIAESAEHGGSLVTARLATEYNREVFAVPGRVTDNLSNGCNNLISAGKAHLLRNADDILSVMHWQKSTSEDIKPEMPDLFTVTPALLDEDEQTVVDTLKATGPMMINELSRRLGRNIGEMMSTLIELEIKGLVIPLAGSRYEAI